VAERSGGLRIAAANMAARAKGIHSGLSAAEAGALAPALKLVPADADGERRDLLALALWCQRYTPWVGLDETAIDGGAGLWLDITGCAHLMGGEASLADHLHQRLQRFGLTARLGLADTPAAAWAVARFGETPIGRVPENVGRQWFDALPTAALRLPAESVATLHRLGLRRIGDVRALPRAPLAARFGAVVGLRLEQLWGESGESIAPLRPAASHRFRRAFAEPIGRGEDIAAALTGLVAALCRRLDYERRGARRLDATLFRVDGTLIRHAVGTARPSRDPGHLARLLAQDLDKLDAGFGIEAIVLEAVEVEALDSRQGVLEGAPTKADDEARARLADRLTARLGAGCLRRFAPAPAHRPEEAVAAAPPLGPDVSPPSWPETAPRPIRLLARPEPVSVDAPEKADAPPKAFRWRGARHPVARGAGPERIADPWWHGARPGSAEAYRDYFRIEDEAGRRFWLFRDGRERWYLHGLFA